MKLYLLLALAAAMVLALIIAGPVPGHAAELAPVEQLEPLHLSFWSSLGAKGSEEDLRAAYLRGFFEATQLWAGVKPQQVNAPARYLKLIQGINLVQVSNLLGRLSSEYPQYRERLTLSEALTACVVRARMGEPLIDDQTAQRLKGAGGGRKP